MNTDLHIATRLKKLLDPLTPEEKKQLKANIESDGEVLDPILFWNDGKKNVVIDGMHRWEIVRNTETKFSTKKMNFASYEEAEIWVLDHQLGRRNLLKPAAIRRIRGELYNRLKEPLTTGVRNAKTTDDVSKTATRQNVGRDQPAAQKVAEKAGVSARTVERDGARVEAIAALSKPAQAIADKATDSEIKALGKLEKADQDKVARLVRTEQVKTVKDAIKKAGVKPAGKRDLGKCPNCGKSKWDEDEDGYSCASCHHPHGEPVGDPDDGAVKKQRQKTVKTCEALMRAFCDLNRLSSNRAHKGCIESCKGLLKIAKEWE
jgi:hypothetical protein